MSATNGHKALSAANGNSMLTWSNSKDHANVSASLSRRLVARSGGVKSRAPLPTRPASTVPLVIECRMNNVDLLLCARVLKPMTKHSLGARGPKRPGFTNNGGTIAAVAAGTPGAPDKRGEGINEGKIGHLNNHHYRMRARARAPLLAARSSSSSSLSAGRRVVVAI